jgi:hypothetical protein
MAGTDPDYQPGDKVKRKTDGRPMTVVEVYPPLFYYRVKCVWGTDPQQSDLFRLDEIEPDPQAG